MSTSILDRFKLTGKVAVVTGAGRGIGRGIALAYADAGANVICAARTQEQIDDTAEQVRARGQQALAVRCDVMEPDDRENVIAAALAEFGRLDVLVNNAGGTPPRDAVDTSERFFEGAFRFNVTTAFLLSRLAAPKMVETAGSGAIVNIASRAGNMVQAGFVAYGTAKAGLMFMTQELGAEWAPKVRVNAIGVGGVATDALDVVVSNPAIKQAMEERTPMRRIGEVEDIAACALYLASPAASWVTGKIFDVDGGVYRTALDVPTKPL